MPTAGERGGRLERAPLGEILKRSAEFLEARGIERAKFDASLLLGHVLGLDRMSLYLQFERPLFSDELERIRDLLRRRARGEPVAYLIGRWGFHALDVRVDARVLVPRPDTETLVDLALERLAGREKPIVADIGTGSGCIALALAHARPDAVLLASDLSAEALEVARANAEALGLADRIRFAAGDLLAPWRDDAAWGRLKAVVSNPPYIVRGDPRLDAAVARHEPALALYVEGTDPFEIGERIAAEARDALAPGGLLAIEIGAGSDEHARERLLDLGYVEVGVAADLAGVPRVVYGSRR